MITYQTLSTWHIKKSLLNAIDDDDDNGDSDDGVGDDDNWSL